MLCQSFFPEALTVGDRKVDAQRIVHMDAWEQVGGRVGGVQPADDPGAPVVTDKLCRAQIMSVRIDG